MDRKKLIYLSLLILVAAALTAVVAKSGNREYWHIFEALTLLAALLFYLPGALIASAVSILIGLIFLPDEQLYLTFARLLLISGVIGWVLSRERKSQENVDRLQMVDRLTGLPNYSYFIDRLEEERQRADRFGSKLSLIMLDIDLFKPFNEQYGHHIGNELLAQLAQIFKSEVRTIDIVCRYGGEEFAVILPNTSGMAAEVAERIRQAVEDFAFPVNKEGKVERKTISAGVATYPKDAEDELQLVDRVDEALYQAKQQGRNAVVVYGRQSKEDRITVQ